MKRFACMLLSIFLLPLLSMAAVRGSAKQGASPEDRSRRRLQVVKEKAANIGGQIREGEAGSKWSHGASLVVEGKAFYTFRFPQLCFLLHNIT
jgi:hypothetical protein